MSKEAVKYIDKEWEENTLALGVKDQWGEIMEAYHQDQLKKIIPSDEEIEKENDMITDNFK